MTTSKSLNNKFKKKNHNTFYTPSGFENFIKPEIHNKFRILWSYSYSLDQYSSDSRDQLIEYWGRSNNNIESYIEEENNLYFFSKKPNFSKNSFPIPTICEP